MAATFEVYTDKQGQFRWRLRHENGKTIADCGEGYASKDNCLQGLNSVQTNVPTAVIKDMTTATTPGIGQN